MSHFRSVKLHSPKNGAREPFIQRTPTSNQTFASDFCYFQTNLTSGSNIFHTKFKKNDFSKQIPPQNLLVAFLPPNRAQRSI